MDEYPCSIICEFPMDDWLNFPLKITTHPWDFIDKSFNGKFIQSFELWEGELNML
jgi:hypothetical protein